MSTIHLVEGYELWEKDSSMNLDKDLSGERVYSLTTTKFITSTENAKLANQKRWHGSN